MTEKTLRRTLVLGAMVAVIAAALAVLLAFRYAHSLSPVQKTRNLTPAKVEAGLRADPVAPDRPFRLREQTLGDSAAWISARPAQDLRYERSSAERGGINPCNTPEPGWGRFTHWRQLADGLITLPESGAVRADGTFDLVLHFHGHELARKEFVRADANFVLLGTSRNDYRSRLAGPATMTTLVEAVERFVSKHAGRPARAAHVALISWSGGYEAVGVLLAQSERKPDAVVLFDGLHTARDANRAGLQLAPFIEFGRRAKRGEAFMFVSHSSIDTDGFASTTESAHRLVAALGGKPLAVSREDPLGLELREAWSSGKLHVRGYAGGGKADHCAHLGLYPMVIRALEREWARR
jgi:hypothetical protein